LKDTRLESGDEELLKLTERNIENNLSRILGPSSLSRCRTSKLLWGDAAAVSALNPPFDVVLAADCAAVVYEDAFRDLVASLVALSHADSIVLLSYQRRHQVEDIFFEELRRWFHVELVPRSDLHPDFVSVEPLPHISEIMVFRLRMLSQA